MKLTTILTERQLEVFMLAVKGYSGREIAKKLNVSDANVSKVVRKVYAKLGARNVVEAINECMSHGLLSVKDLRRKGEEAEA